jgi:putative membrane protein
VCVRSKEPTWWPAEGEEPDPRWSLANERTFLAYNRTALALVVAGLAVAGSPSFTDVPNGLAAVVGLPLIMIGAAVAIGSRGRFIEVQRAMRNRETLPAPRLTNVLSAGIAAVAVAALAVAVIYLA